MDKIATALASVYEILTEMKSLTTSAQLSSATDDDIAAYQASFIDYISDITTLSDQVTVAGDPVMDDANDTVIIQVGIATTSTREFYYVDTSIDTLGLDSATLDFADSENIYSTSTEAEADEFSIAIEAAYTKVDAAMDTVAGYISTIASAQIVLDINTDFVNSMIKNNSIS
jgi:flagellin-like hook-associated protein FlgL